MGPTRSLSLGLGQHILNGLVVALGVGLVAFILSLWFGFASGMAAGSGAVCVSIADQPNPLASKFRILPLSLALGVAASTLIAQTEGHAAQQGLVVVAISFCAGMLVGYGRWALPVSVLAMLAVVFALGAPSRNPEEELGYETMFALGGLLYVVIALGLTRITEPSGRRIAVGETVREFARYLRAMADFYDPSKDLVDVYRGVIEQQAALADHLQAARQQVFLGRRTSAAKRLAAAIVVQLDALDSLVSTHADYAPLRRGDTGDRLPAMIAALARDLAADLEGLAVALLHHRSRLALPDRRNALDKISEEVARLQGDAGIAARSLRAARATRTKFSWVAEHLSRLPKALQSDEAAEALLRGIELSAFLQPILLSPKVLRRHLSLASPVMRHAIRLAAAMGVGYLLLTFVPMLRHGNWILLTIAVILRAQYSVTRQRRNDRLLGNLIGCLIAALLLRTLPQTAMLALIPVAVGTAHAYVRVNYLLTSIAACVMAILSLHFLDPIAAPPILDRLLDTVIGAAICFAFSRLLPRWEYQEAPKLVSALVKSFRLYVADALRVEIGEQSYRLARKTFMESMAAISESAARVGAEPEHARTAMPTDLGTLLSAAYSLAAQIVGIRMLLSHRRTEISPDFADSLLQRSRDAVLGQLDLTHEVALDPDFLQEEETAIDPERALVIRCTELCAAAAQLHAVAADFRK